MIRLLSLGSALAHSPMLCAWKLACCVCEKVTVDIICASLLAFLNIPGDRAIIVHALHVQAHVHIFVASWKQKQKTWRPSRLRDNWKNALPRQLSLLTYLSTPRATVPQKSFVFILIRLISTLRWKQQKNANVLLLLQQHGLVNSCFQFSALASLVSLTP